MPLWLAEYENEEKAPLATAHLPHMGVASSWAPSACGVLLSTLRAWQTIDDMTFDVKKHQRAAAQVEKDVPLTITVGLFYVSAANVRKFIVERHQQLAEGILKVIVASHTAA